MRSPLLNYKQKVSNSTMSLEKYFSLRLTYYQVPLFKICKTVVFFKEINSIVLSVIHVINTNLIPLIRIKLIFLGKIIISETI